MSVFSEFVHRIQQQLQQPLPGIVAQQKMASSLSKNRQWQFKHEQTARQAATLLLLYEKPGGIICTALMQRTKDGYAHGGQISFPGGRKDPNDADHFATALRETEEEFGVPRESVQVLGKLTDLYIPASNNMIFPVVGCLHTEAVFAPNKAEVEQVIEVPLSYLQQSDIVKQTVLRPYLDLDLDVPYFDVYGHIVWGATAMLLSEFLEVMERM